MGRRKIEIKPIKDDRNRSVTFLKRKGGLFKKAHELSVLCSVDVAVIIFGGANKKLYQYCSGDIGEIIGRHSYYDSAHESKGPADFQGKKDLEDDEDDEMGHDRAGSHSSNDHTLPHHIHGHPGLPHMNARHTASASPPTHARNIVGPQGPYPMPGRVGTPQPITRPNSRNQAQRRNSSNLVPANAFPATQPPPQPNGAYPYMTHQPVYNPQQPGIPMQPTNINQMQAYPYPPPPQQPTQAQAQAEAYITETSRRQSMPPAFSSERTVTSSENSPPTRPVEEAVPAPEKRAPAKSRSMFTPIGPSDSMLAAHFGFGGTTERSHSIDVGSVQRNGVTMGGNNQNVKRERQEPSPKSNPMSLPVSTAAPTNSTEASQLPPPPLTRSASLPDGKPAVRPNLKLRIPSEQPEDASPTNGSSPAESGTAGNDSSKARQLPRPSPSPGAILSAGTTGPVNPFARPPPITSGPEQTPMSALPSRFTEGILSSPSSNMNFYGEWALPFPQGRDNGNNMLPSPLNFQTPVGSFGHGPMVNGKRKSPGPDDSENAPAKRPKA